MKKIMLIVIFSLVSFLINEFNVVAAVVRPEIYCEYYGKTNNKVHRGVINISNDSSEKTKVSGNDNTNKSKPKMSNDEEILNWTNAKYGGTAGIGGKDLGYVGKTAYQNTKKCPDYMIYIELEDCNLNCVRIFVSDADHVDTMKDALLNLNNWNTNVGDGDEPYAYKLELIKSILYNGDTSSEEWKEVYEADCSLLDGTVINMLNKILNIFRIVAPILALVFSSADFLKAVAGGAKEELKNAGTRLLKRLIIVVLLFFVPTIIKLLLEITGNSSGTCGVN